MTPPTRHRLARLLRGARSLDPVLRNPHLARDVGLDREARPSPAGRDLPAHLRQRLLSL